MTWSMPFCLIQVMLAKALKWAQLYWGEKKIFWWCFLFGELIQITLVNTVLTVFFHHGRLLLWINWQILQSLHAVKIRLSIRSVHKSLNCFYWSQHRSKTMNFICWRSNWRSLCWAAPKQFSSISEVNEGKSILNGWFLC